MKRNLCLIVIFAMAGACQAQYRAILLQPPGTASAAAAAWGGYQVGTVYSFSPPQAMLWNGDSVGYTVLTPTGFDGSRAYGIWDDVQVGSALISYIQGYEHAVVWRGSAASAVDFNPSGYDNSFLQSINGTSMVGGGHDYAHHGPYLQALYWPSLSSSAIDLNPAGYQECWATSVSQTAQAGYGYGPQGSDHTHALLWHGSASDYADLNPLGLTSSFIGAMSDDIQVGWGGNSQFAQHAYLWHGTADSAVDLNPAGITTSMATGCALGLQVGLGSGTATGGQQHALVWNGSPDSCVDLHQYLTGLGSFQSSRAWGIDPETGDIVGGADSGLNHYAVLWKKVTAETVVPSEQSVLLGKLTAGDLQSLAADDGNAEVLCKFIVPSNQSPFVSTTLTYQTTKSNPTDIALNVKAKYVNAGVYVVHLLQYDYANGQDVETMPETALTGSYTVYTGTATGNLLDFVGTNGEMKAKVTVRQTGPSASVLPCVSFEYAQLVVTG